MWELCVFNVKDKDCENCVYLMLNVKSTIFRQDKDLRQCMLSKEDGYLRFIKAEHCLNGN